ncbi:Putative multicopper oxidase, type 1, multicopper oxidase, copper-binding, cupredoxin [Septoria linicola]|uniref:Multicopper oxidase, type 1, multicopper oxidase, copper-binding, cupredoxin n=1 Tax=Septoria linicola TaxID=215465 RepID=A0A9Q9AIW8_9PEZI|nr:Putative multicopper oxidase, type 1, multicopper oxidase, copper-binding, cupredoxin [Septoria linicola]
MRYIKSLVILVLLTCLDSTFARTAHFSIDIAEGLLDPTNTGPRPGILVNGTFPGPQLRLKVGDDLEFKVRNLYHEDIAIHFHGIKQAASPWSDGVPGVTQAAIHPGASFVYRWRAEEAGTSFYHGHSRGHIMDGLYGAIIIEPDVYTSRPFHLISKDASEQKAMVKAESQLQALLLGDYTHMPFEEFDHVQSNANAEILCMDSIIVNGRGAEYCLSRPQIDNVTDDTVWKLLDLVNVTGGLTDKGCLPPLQIVQGDFDMNLTALPARTFDQCDPGSHPQANYTVNVKSRDGWAALSFINAGAQHPLLVDVDGHVMHVISVDSQYIRPFTTDQVAVGNGNRIHVLIKLDQPAGRYTIRIANQLPSQVVAGYAHLVYDGIDRPATSSSKFNFAGRPLPGTQGFVLFDETMAVPYPPLQPAATVDRTHKFLLKKLGAPHTSGEWTLSGLSGYNSNLEHASPPLLFEPPDEPSDLFLRTFKNEWVDLIVETEGPISRYHPMHKHGNKFFVIGFGTGRYPWDTVEEGMQALPPGSFNLQNPPYLDTVRTKTSMTGAWLALRYKVEQSGAWMFHCHIQPHLSGGMGMVILDGVDYWPKTPDMYMEWNGFEPPTVAKVDLTDHGELKA